MENEPKNNIPIIYGIIVKYCCAIISEIDHKDFIEKPENNFTFNDPMELRIISNNSNIGNSGDL